MRELLLLEPPSRVSPRSLGLRRAPNARDLGGYPTAGGGSVRSGVLFRADGLHRLEADDLALVEGAGVRTVIDLRTVAEIEATGRFAPTDAVVYHHVPIIEATWGVDDVPAETDLIGAHMAVRYRDMLTGRGARFAEAIVVLAGPGALPAVFHCSAGKDRTGLLAALLLGLLGVDDDTIIEDYHATTANLEAMLAVWSADRPESFVNLAGVPLALMRSPRESMQAAVGHIHSTYGGFEGYAEWIGVPGPAVDALRDALLV